MVSILVIDADEKIHFTLGTILPGEYSFHSAFTGGAGLSILKTEAPELILLGDNIADFPFFDFLRQISSLPHAPPVITMSRNHSLPYVVQTVRSGSYMFLRKPFQKEELTLCVLEALHYSSSLQSSLPFETDHSAFSDLIGSSDGMKQVKEFIARYAPSPYPILIFGESGTGKDLIAQAVHALSPRENAPFFAINCGAISPTLIQSELFGSEKGAYTDAVSKAGCFELAHTGSLFLDEIGEMNLSAQVNLLRVLENAEVTRLGSPRAIPVDVRIISATNKNLNEEIIRGNFRQDLFYRLNTLILPVPPLRERKCDIPALARHFVATAGNNHVLSNGSLNKLTDYHWPGNVRELKTIIHRSVLFTEDEIIEPRHILINL